MQQNYLWYERELLESHYIFFYAQLTVILLNSSVFKSRTVVLHIAHM